MPAPPPVYVVDTSVVVKWYVEREESDVEKAWELLHGLEDGLCVLKAPELLLFEIANALMTSQGFQTAVVTKALDELQNLRVSVEPFSPSTLAQAVEIASLCRATIYDAYFLALASELGAVLVTADEVFLRKAHRYPQAMALRNFRLPN